MNTDALAIDFATVHRMRVEHAAGYHAEVEDAGVDGHTKDTSTLNYHDMPIKEAYGAHKRPMVERQAARIMAEESAREERFKAAFVVTGETMPAGNPTNLQRGITPEWQRISDRLHALLAASEDGLRRTPRGGNGIE